jgi:polyisoprenoid-binding protein YceI
MKRILLVALALAACGSPQRAPAPAPAQPAVEAQVVSTAPAGAYTLDKAHASLIVRLDHLGYSHFTARFERWDAQLNFDPAAPEQSQINVSIDPRSVASDNPPPGFLNIMRGVEFLDASRFPVISFHSTRVERTGPSAARIVGDLTLHGVTKPVTLEARFNGGYPGMQLDPHARAGFSAHGVFNRSDFGMGYGLPPAGTHFGVGDAVEVIVETEFSGPAWSAPATSAPATPSP